jgi:hypothetical protein
MIFLYYYWINWGEIVWCKLDEKLCSGSSLTIAVIKNAPLVDFVMKLLHVVAEVDWDQKASATFPTKKIQKALFLTGHCGQSLLATMASPVCGGF